MHPCFYIAIDSRFLREGQKSLALLALRRKKAQQQLLNQTEEHLLQVNQLISNVEVASLQIQVVKALESGTLALKALQSEVSTDYVAELIDQNSALRADLGEVNDLLNNLQSSDPEVYEEFRKLEDEIAAQKELLLPAVPKSSLLPVGTTRASNEQVTEESTQAVELDA